MILAIQRRSFNRSRASEVRGLSGRINYGLMSVQKQAKLLVGYSTDVRPGEIVSLIGPPAAEPLIVALYREVLRVGGHPVVWMVPNACSDILFHEGNERQLSFVDPLELREVETADVTIHVLTANLPQSLAGLDPVKQRLRNAARQTLLQTFQRRAEADAIRWVATIVPTAVLAHDAGLSLSELDELIARAAMLDTPDPQAAWRTQAEVQERRLELFAGVHELHLTTPTGTDLRLVLEGRTWLNGAGHANLPDGEIYSAPVEDATEGVVQIDFPTRQGGEWLTGIRLRFRAGKVIDASASQGEEVLHRLLALDAGASFLGEIGFGCNPHLHRPTGHALLDEKIGGTFHLGLGASYADCGGCNVSSIHWDLVGDLRRGGRVEGDGVVFSENGRFFGAER